MPLLMGSLVALAGSFVVEVESASFWALAALVLLVGYVVAVFGKRGNPLHAWTGLGPRSRCCSPCSHRCSCRAF